MADCWFRLPHLRSKRLRKGLGESTWRPVSAALVAPASSANAFQVHYMAGASEGFKAQLGRPDGTLSNSSKSVKGENRHLHDTCMRGPPPISIGWTRPDQAGAVRIPAGTARNSVGTSRKYAGIVRRQTGGIEHKGVRKRA